MVAILTEYMNESCLIHTSQAVGMYPKSGEDASEAKDKSSVRGAAS